MQALVQTYIVVTIILNSMLNDHIRHEHARGNIIKFVTKTHKSLKAKKYITILIFIISFYHQGQGSQI